AGRRRCHRRRTDVLPGAQSRPDRRTLPDAQRTGVLMTTHAQVRSVSIWDSQIVSRAIWDSLRKLHPRTMAKNPVMFVVEIASVLTTWRVVQDAITRQGHLGFACHSHSCLCL